MWKRTFFTYKRLSKPRDLPYNEGRQTGRRPVCAVCRKSMGGGFLEQIKVRLMEELQTPVAFTIPLFGGIPVTLSVVVSWLVMGALILAAALGTRQLKLRDPGKPQLCLEMAVEFLNGFTKNNMGPHGPDFAPYLGTIALYILLCNIIGIFGLVPPTKDLNVTAALAIMSAVLIYGAQFRYHGLRGGLKKFMEPMPLLLPINLMEVVIRPLALCMRLFGNNLGAFIIMELIKMMAPAVVPVPFSIYFDLFDGGIQAVVFVFLTALFVGEGIKEEE